MSVDRRLLAAVVLLALALFIASGASPITVPTNDTPDPGFIAVTDDTKLWPYTAHAPDFASQTLPINLIVYAEPAQVERHLRVQTRGDWNRTEDATSDVNPIGGLRNGTLTAWASAGGATRYVHIRHPAADFDLWLSESYQLHDGDYFGTRYHIRAYESPIPGERWVALQAHREHWDWFRLRHTVDGVESAQSRVEQEFMDRWFVADLARTYVGSDRGPNTNGWITIVEFEAPGTSIAALLAIGVPVLRRLTRSATSWTDTVTPRTQHMVALATAVSAVYLGVRFAAIGAERVIPLADPRIIAVVLFPVVFAGLPAAAYRFAYRLDQPAAFAAAAIGFSTAVLLDYTYLQVTVLPLDTLVHRAALAIALGLVAAGSTPPADRDDRGDRAFRTGLLLWFVALGMPLVRFV